MAFSGGVFSLISGNPVTTATVISSSWANDTLSDIATNGLSMCLLKDGSQTVTANIPMASFKITGLGAQTAANDAVRLEAIGTHASTFTWNGSGGSTGSLTLNYQKIGSWVTLRIPVAKATTGTSSTTLVIDTALPAALRPTAVTQTQPYSGVWNNGVATGATGQIRVPTDGTLTILRDNLGSTFTNSAEAGTSHDTSITYFVS